MPFSGKFSEKSLSLRSSQLVLKTDLKEEEARGEDSRSKRELGVRAADRAGWKMKRGLWEMGWAKKGGLQCGARQWWGRRGEGEGRAGVGSQGGSSSLQTRGIQRISRAPQR